MNVAWLKNQDGIVLAYKVLRPTKPFFPPPVHANPFLPRPPSPLPGPPSPQELALPKATSIEPTQFPRGSVDLHACRLFPTEKLCTSESIVRAANSRPRLPSDHHTSPTHPIPIQHIAAAATLQATLYTNKIEEATATDVGTYSTTNSAFTDAFTGHYDSGRASIAPKSSDCKQAHAPHSRTFAPHTHSRWSHALRPLHPLRTPTPGVPRPRVCEATAIPTRRVRAVHDIRKECQRRRERE